MSDRDGQTPIQRRRLLQYGAAGVALIPVLTLGTRSAIAAEKIAETHATAVALGYVHDATKVDVAKFPKRAGAEGAKQFCYNCLQYKASAEDGWGTCAIFPNYLVAKDGWCNVWVPIA